MSVLPIPIMLEKLYYMSEVKATTAHTSICEALKHNRLDVSAIR